MPNELWSQDIFSKGELSPFMYGRATVAEYGNGLKVAQNVLTYPTGAAGKRFGTLYQATLNAALTSPLQLYFQTFQYLDVCIFQMVFYPLNIDIYLEGILVANVTTTLDATSVYNLISTVLGPIFRITGANFHPQDLTLSTTDYTITGVSGNTFTVGSSSYTVGQIFPVRFTTTSALPTTSPQIKAGVSYFVRNITTSSFSVYATPQDAKANTNAFTLTNAGTGTNVAKFYNAWTLANTYFKNLPVYDFNGSTTSYDGLTFTPGDTTGVVTITVSGGSYAPLNSSYVGGAFIGGGGTSRITAVASTTSFTVAVQTPFDSKNAIQGSLAFLAEPAWSDARGWPEKCSSYQNRALFSNTDSLPNGFWASVINDYTDFGDLTTDPDDAIAWYPSSNDVNFIRFIVPYRSITVHTNTGIYSSPLSDITAITPQNFTLQLQDSTPADVLQPQAIDNQILVLSGNDAHQMLWDGINNAYTSDIVSVINEQTIRNPVDETAFVNLHRAGSRFVFIINENGSMAIFQTLLSQNVSGFTPHILEQSYGNASFIQAASSADGRCWFVNQRQIATAGSQTAITGYTTNTLQLTGTNYSTTTPTAVLFATTGSLPTSTPQIELNTYYWAIGVDANDVKIYLSQEDALAGVNNVMFSNAGSSSNVTPWPLSTIFTLEELSFDTFLDCAVQYTGSPTDTVSTGALFNAQNVAMVGDGYGFTAVGEGNQVVFEAHGSTVNVSEAYIGFPINLIIEPMPLSLANGASAKNTTLTRPKRIRFVRFMFKSTIGGTINGVPITILPFDQNAIGEPPFPATGYVELSILNAWDDFNNPTYTIEHSDPFDIQLLGVYYSVDI